MSNRAVMETLVRAGIDPARVFVGLRQPFNPRLRAPSHDELVVVRNHIKKLGWSSPRVKPDAYAGIQNPDAPWGPQVGADSPMAPVFAGWNVWAVWQVMDLPFSVMMVGVSRDSQLKIWVEDQVRLHAPGAEVADPLDLKGGQVEILTGSPGLQTAMRKENVPGPALVVETQDVAPQLRFVRFFNRGAASELPWPHDESYLLDAVFRPDAANSATKGSGPGTILDRNITGPAGAAGKTVLEVAAVAALLAALGYAALQGLKHK